MKKGFKPSSWIFPQPAIVIATYDKDGRPDAMTAAWAGIYDTNKIGIMLDHRHRTMENIKETGAFTVSMSTMETMAESDYFGTVSGNTVEDKIRKAGFHTAKSEYVNAPVIEEYPLTFECKVEKLIPEGEDFHVVGSIVHILAEESVLTDGKPDPAKLRPLAFDGVNGTYMEVVRTVGKAWKEGRKKVCEIVS